MQNSKLMQGLFDSAELKKRLALEQAQPIERAGQAMVASLREGRKLLFFGNGGSAADAQHLAAEFVGRFRRERQPLPAIALTTDTSILTCIGNDYGFEQVFARQVLALGQPGDVAVAISTSGRSPNVLVAVQAARERGMTTIGLTGGDGGPLAQAVDIPIVVPSTVTARIQECHITIGHIWCEFMDEAWSQVESVPFGKPGTKVVDWDILLTLREQWRTEHKTVVWTNGCFDLFHVGHLRSLQAARRFGDVLIVGLNSDASARRIKGPNRPIMSQQERAEILAALACVDYVVIFDENTPEAALARLKPDIHCKGADYAPPKGKPIPEASVVESYGGRIAFIPLIPEFSTTDLVQRIQERGKS